LGLGAFGDLLYNQAANDLAAEFVRGKIREIVHDPEIAEMLSPRNVIGCKRLCVDTGYWETYNRPNVTLIDVSGEPIEAITPAGIRAKDQEYAVDAIVFATGFDAMTGALLKIDIRGTGGQALKEKWREGPKTYLGLGIAGFPNLFTITGPGSPSVLTNMLPSIEQHVEWVADCIGYLREEGLSRIEAQAEAEENWVAHVREVAGGSLRSTCSSWYIGANVPGKPRVFMPYIGGFPAYVQKCDAVAANAYEGFALAELTWAGAVPVSAGWAKRSGPLADEIGELLARRFSSHEQEHRYEQEEREGKEGQRRRNRMGSRNPTDDRR
jgi:hypothetical protein